MTNADRIRNMTDEELANLLDDSLSFFSCGECEKDMSNKSSDLYCTDCKDWILRFLQKDAV